MWSKLVVKHYPQLLLLIVAFTFFTRIVNLHNPERYMFDEVYHAVTAKLIAQDDPRAFEWHNPPPEPDTAVDWLHPPLAKYTQALSISIFGANSFGWRFSSVLFGCCVVLLAAFIADELFENKSIALLAAFLTALDGLVLTMSRIAMNDIHVTTFILLSMLYYLKFYKTGRSNYKFLLGAGVSAGLAVSSKWSGVFAIGFIGLIEAIHLIKALFSGTKNQTIWQKFSTNIFPVLKKGVLLTLICLILPAGMYVGSYAKMYLQGKDLSHLKELHKNIWWYQNNLDATHPAQSTPVQWFFNTKPVWIAADYTTPGMRGDIYAVGNPALFFFGIVALAATVLFLLKKTKDTSERSLKSNLLLLLVAYLIVWLPWQLSPRIMFFYHYLPAVPLLAINLSFWIYTLGKKRVYIAAMIVALTFINFCVWYPHWTLIPVEYELKDSLYFYLESWKQT